MTFVGAGTTGCLMVEGIDKARAKAIHYFFQKAMQNPEPLTNQEKMSSQACSIHYWTRPLQRAPFLIDRSQNHL